MRKEDQEKDNGLIKQLALMNEKDRAGLFAKCAFLIEEKKRHNPLLYMLKSRHGFIDWQRRLMESKKTNTLMIGGNRSGKTEFLVTNLLLFFQGDHPRQEMGICRNPPYVDPTETREYISWVVSTSFPNIETILLKCKRYVKQSILKYPYDFNKSYDKKLHRLNFLNDSFIEFKTYNQALDSFHGEDLDSINFDEEPDPRIFTACLTRLIDRKGFSITIAATIEEITTSWMNEFSERVQRLPKYKQAWNYKFAKTSENPFISIDSLSAVREMLSEEDRIIKLGEGNTNAFRKYKNFLKGYPHVIPYKRIPLNWTRYLGMDFHNNKPSTVVLLAVNEVGRMVCYHEFETPRNADYETIVDTVLLEKQFDADPHKKIEFGFEIGDAKTLAIKDSNYSRGVTMSKLDCLREEGWVELEPVRCRDKDHQGNLLNDMFKIRRWCLKCKERFDNKHDKKCSYCGSTEYEEAPTLQIMVDKDGNGCPKLIDQLPLVFIDRPNSRGKRTKDSFDDSDLDYAQALRFIVGDNPTYLGKIIRLKPRLNRISVYQQPIESFY